MRVTSILPAIKVTKESDMMGCDLYISAGDKIKITCNDGQAYIGRYLFTELGKYEEEDDTLIIEVENNNIEIYCSDILDIEELGGKIKWEILLVVFQQKNWNS